VQRGAVLGGLNTSTIAGLQIVTPPILEQNELLNVVEAKTGALRLGMAAIEGEIALLREHRTRLIADVVTGKLDVREAAARLPDEPDECEPIDALAEEEYDTVVDVEDA
jgi:type I restriction enzyme S subunit